jgi:hypothetical protein
MSDGKDKIKTYTKAELAAMFRYEDDCGITYKEVDGSEMAYLPDDEEMGRCTNCARYVVNRLGQGDIYGFMVEDMPVDYFYRPLSIAGGHDFAVINNRYIVDIWLSLYSGDEKQTVYDLQDPDDRALARRIYGDRKYWSWLNPKTDKFEKTTKKTAYRTARTTGIQKIKNTTGLGTTK